MARIQSNTILLFVGGLVSIGCQQQPSSTYQSQPPAEQSATPGESPEMYGEEPMAEEDLEEALPEAMKEEEETAMISEGGREFIDKAASGGMAEVELSRIAVASAKTPTVREFAQKMIDSHTKMNEELTTLARRFDVAPPTMLTEEAQKAKDELGQLQGKKLEQKYIDIMVEDHQRTVDLFRDQSENDGDPELQRFAAEQLPMLEEHLEHARHIDAGKTYRPPQASTPPGATHEHGTDEPGMMPPTSSRKP